MLQKAIQRVSPWAIALGLITAFSGGVAQAALFEQADVDSEKFIAIAVPLPQGNRYNLIVLEQKSDARLCWEESGDVGVINPLLLTFDFSEICGRSTDSNGYSIRQVGEDLGLKYRLSLQEKDGVLVLMGVPLESSYGKAVEIGRTQSVSDDYLKITLNPDWRFTRRVYQGQPLGHIYFTRDEIPLESEASVEASLDLDVSDPDAGDLDSDESGLDLGDSEALVDSQDSEVSLIVTPLGESTPEQSPAQGEESSEDVAPSLADPQPLDAPIQIPVPAPPSTSGQLNLVEPISDALPAPMTKIPVPSIAPLGQVGASEPDVFLDHDLPAVPQVEAAGDPPPPPFKISRSIQRYRIYVKEPDAAAQSDGIKTFAPDAFWTSHQGQRMLQVGAFFEKKKADWMMDKLGELGINGIIDASAQ